MNREFISRRAFCLLSGISGILGVVMLVVSFNINPGLPGDASVPVLIQFAQQHEAAELWGAWLQAVGPAFIVLFAFALVHLAGATQRLAGMHQTRLAQLVEKRHRKRHRADGNS